MRNRRAGTPPMPSPPRPPCRETPRSRCRADGSTSLRRTSRERGPAIENCAHCSLTDESCTSSSGHSHLVAELHMLQHLGGVGRGGGDDEAVLGQPRGGAVVEHEAVLAQHQAVARPADRELGPGVGVEPVQEPAASAPCMSILPSVDTSHTPTLPRTVRTSRLTLSSQSVSPARGYHCARSQAPLSTNTAPCSCAQRCDGGSRVGLNSLPRCGPASAPIGDRRKRRAERRRAGLRDGLGR